MADLGQPDYRTKQVWKWLADGAGSWEEMTNLPAGLRDDLSKKLPISCLEVSNSALSVDGTEKALFLTSDPRPVEAVLTPYPAARPSPRLSSKSA